VSEPAWSPDGQHIAFAGSRNLKSGGYLTTDLFVMNADGSGLRRLAKLPGDEHDPDWSPDGRLPFSEGATP
jgi:TolB protein